MSSNPDTLNTRLHFSDEQAMLLEAASNFCRDKSPSSAVRARFGSDTGFDPAHWQAMVDMGWLGVAVPEQHGGSALGIAACVVLAEPLGRHLLHTPFVATQLAIQGLLAGGTAAQQADWLPRLATGAVGTVALFEDDGDWDLGALQSQARLAGGTASLSGNKTLVPDAGVADLLLASVQLDGAPALVLLTRTELAGRLQRETVVDETRRSFSLRLDGLAVPADRLITGDQALLALQAMRQAAWLLAAAEAAGGIAGSLAVTVDYLNTRNAFGRKIGSYQALKHGCADILCQLERVRSHVYHAATLLADGDDAEIALRMAKAEAGDAAVQAGDRAVQFHGGFGFTWDCDAQLYLRRALWLQPWFGDAGHHRRALAGLLLDRAAA
ncbi:MAG: acyl-CoA dehydrogenase family protein [Pseudomonadota bacterium]